MEKIRPRRVRARPASRLDAGDLGRTAADAQPQRGRPLSRARAARRRCRFPSPRASTRSCTGPRPASACWSCCSALDRSRAAAWIGAVTYVFSGVVVSEAFFPHIQPGMALLPWILWAVARPGRGAVASASSDRRALRARLSRPPTSSRCAIAIGSAALWIALESDRATRLRRARHARRRRSASARSPRRRRSWRPPSGSRRPTAAVLGMKLSDVRATSRSTRWRLLELVDPVPVRARLGDDARGLCGAGRSSAAGPMGIFDTLYCRRVRA